MSEINDLSVAEFRSNIFISQKRILVRVFVKSLYNLKAFNENEYEKILTNTLNHEYGHIAHYLVPTTKNYMRTHIRIDKKREKMKKRDH